MEGALWNIVNATFFLSPFSAACSFFFLLRKFPCPFLYFFFYEEFRGLIFPGNPVSAHNPLVPRCCLLFQTYSHLFFCMFPSVSDDCTRFFLPFFMVWSVTDTISSCCLSLITKVWLSRLFFLASLPPSSSFSCLYPRRLWLRVRTQPLLEITPGTPTSSPASFDGSTDFCSQLYMRFLQIFFFDTLFLYPPPPFA